MVRAGLRLNRGVSGRKCPKDWFRFAENRCKSTAYYTGTERAVPMKAGAL